MSKYTKFAEIARLEALHRFEKAARTDEDFYALTLVTLTINRIKKFAI
jgi:hypothetical protein